MPFLPSAMPPSPPAQIDSRPAPRAPATFDMRSARVPRGNFETRRLPLQDSRSRDTANVLTEGSEPGDSFHHTRREVSSVVGQVRENCRANGHRLPFHKPASHRKFGEDQRERLQDNIDAPRPRVDGASLGFTPDETLLDRKLLEKALVRRRERQQAPHIWRHNGQLSQHESNFYPRIIENLNGTRRIPVNARIAEIVADQRETRHIDGTDRRLSTDRRMEKEAFWNQRFSYDDSAEYQAWLSKEGDRGLLEHEAQLAQELEYLKWVEKVNDNSEKALAKLKRSNGGGRIESLMVHIRSQLPVDFDGYDSIQSSGGAKARRWSNPSRRLREDIYFA